MARRPLLTDEERRLFFASRTTPTDWRGNTPSPGPTRITWRHAAAPPIGWALPYSWRCLRHPGMGLAHMEEPVGVLVEWLAAQLGIPAAAFADYAARPQTMTDHALKLATTLSLRPPSNADLPFMIEAAAQSAWSTDRGAPIVVRSTRPIPSARKCNPRPGETGDEADDRVAHSPG
jgi:hypothetical protein